MKTIINTNNFLTEIDVNQLSVEESVNCYEVLLMKLLQMKKKVVEEDFKNKEEEILFFKIQKPELMSKTLFYGKVFKIEVEAPTFNYQRLIEYYTLYQNDYYLNFIKKHKHTVFYRYWLTKRSDRDEEFFLRKNFKIKNLLHLPMEFDPAFSTYYDVLIAEYKCFNMINEFLNIKIESIRNVDLSVNQFVKGSNSLGWKGSQADLVELIYALFEADVLIAKSIQNVANSFENYFGIKLNDVYHTFHRMKTRAGSRTKFIDQLRYALERSLDKNIS